MRGVVKLKFRDLTGSAVTCHRMLQAEQKVPSLSLSSLPLSASHRFLSLSLSPSLSLSLSLTAKEGHDEDPGRLHGEDWASWGGGWGLCRCSQFEHRMNAGHFCIQKVKITRRCGEIDREVSGQLYFTLLKSGHIM